MNNMEIILIPATEGLIKVYIYGFVNAGGPGKVYATFNDLVVSSKGYHRKRTIVKTLSKLHDSMAKHG